MFALNRVCGVFRRGKVDCEGLPGFEDYKEFECLRSISL